MIRQLYKPFGQAFGALLVAHCVTVSTEGFIGILFRFIQFGLGLTAFYIAEHLNPNEQTDKTQQKCRDNQET